MTKLSIIIVSYNTKNLLHDCLSSVFAHLPKTAKVIVIDNASTDGSSQMIQHNFPQARLIKNSTNTGFTQANNQGIKENSAKYNLLLNSDTIIESDIFSPLINFMDSHPKVGIASPKLLNKDQTIQPQGGALPCLSNLTAFMWFIDDLPLIKQIFPAYHQSNPNYFHKTRSIGWVAGTAMMLRRKTLDQIGLLDENIFMYTEDVELCFRAARANWQIYTLSQAQLIHLNHGSSSSSHAILGEYKGLQYYFHKHKPPWEQPFLRFLLKSGALLRMILFGKIMGDKRRYEIYQQASQLV